MIALNGSMIYKIALERNVLGAIPLNFEDFMILSQHVFRHIESSGQNPEFVVFDNVEYCEKHLSTLFGEKFYIIDTTVSFANVNYFAKDYILFVDTFKKQMTIGSFNEDTILIHRLKE